MSDLNLPVLDFALLDAGPEQAALFREQLRAATHDVGFFYLTGTGVDGELEAQLHRAARDFFALPDADKLAIIDGEWHYTERQYLAPELVGDMSAHLLRTIARKEA